MEVFAFKTMEKQGYNNKSFIVSLGTVDETCFEARLRPNGLDRLDYVSAWVLNWFLAKTTETLCRDKAPAASDRPR